MDSPNSSPYVLLIDYRTQSEPTWLWTFVVLAAAYVHLVLVEKLLKY